MWFALDIKLLYSIQTLSVSKTKHYHIHKPYQYQGCETFITNLRNDTIPIFVTTSSYACFVVCNISPTCDTQHAMQTIHASPPTMLGSNIYQLEDIDMNACSLYSEYISPLQPMGACLYCEILWFVMGIETIALDKVHL